MSESWINRLWQLLLVCVFAVVLSVCNKALDGSSDSGTSSGAAFADGPVTITAMPKLSVESTTTVSSMPAVSLDNGTTLAVSSMPALKAEISSIPSLSFDNGSSFDVTSMPTLKTDITSMPSQTVEILAGPKVVLDNSSSLAVSSIPSVTIASMPLPTISGVMNCRDVKWGTSTIYYNCDASDYTILSTIDSFSRAITHDDAFEAGWRLVGSSCSFGNGANYLYERCFLFHK